MLAYWSRLQNTLVYNNSLYCNTLNINDEGSPPATGTIVRGNVIYCPSGGVNLWPGTGAASVSNNMVGTNPGWANGDAGNLHVSAGSPTLNACPVLSQATPDFDGETRNSAGGGYDCGADERSGAPAGPPPATLQFVQQPTDEQWGTNITPPITVRVLDATGAPYLGTVPVTMELATDPHGGTLSGTTVQTSSASTGLATFADLRINIVGAGYQLGRRVLV